jgi:hypothetical protein
MLAVHVNSQEIENYLPRVQHYIYPGHQISKGLELVRGKIPYKN